MNIEIDYNPSPSNSFFISVSLNDKEVISFDYTLKGHRVTKQVLIEKKHFSENSKINGEWDVLVLDDGRFVKKYHARWIDLGKKDWVNDEVWETAWSKPISVELRDKLLFYSRFISDNYGKLEKFAKELKEFESLLSEEIAKYV